MATTDQQQGGNTTVANGVSYWRLYCQTETQGVEGYSVDAPTQCFNNPNPTTDHPAHVFDPSSVIKLFSVEPNKVMIEEEEVSTGGHYVCNSFAVNVAPGSTALLDITMPFPINVMRAWTETQDNQRGDVLSVYFIPNTEIGVLTAAIPAGTTVLPVNPTVPANAYLGIEVTLVGTATSETVNRVVAIDSVNNTITVETPTVNAYDPYTTAITVTRHYIKDFEFGGSRLYTWSSGRSMGSYVPVGLTGECSYRNNSTTDTKRFILVLEYLF